MFPRPNENFFQAAVRKLALDVRYDANALAAIPATGPVVVVANHPYGVLDGIVISWLISKVRTDFVVLTNAVLMRAPEINGFILPVDFSETDEAQKTNIASRAAARAQLEKGGVVVVFPAGAVSTAPDKLGLKPAVDWRWQPFVAQLIQRSKAPVVPVWFSGQNSRLFQIASHVSSTLRISLIFHEVRSRIGTALPVVIGAPIPLCRTGGDQGPSDARRHLARPRLCARKTRPGDGEETQPGRAAVEGGAENATGGVDPPVARRRASARTPVCRRAR